MQMASINRVVLVGNLGADPELRLLPSGDSVASFRMATKDRRLDGKGGYIEVTEWHRISMYSRLAEVARKYLKKGSQVYVEGKLRSSVWIDRQGIQRKTWGVIAEHMQMLGKPEHRAQEVAAHTEDEMAWMAGPVPQDSMKDKRTTAIPNDFDDDIPF
jgi:single-strand DNA-binding protein